MSLTPRFPSNSFNVSVCLIEFGFPANFRSSALFSVGTVPTLVCCSFTLTVGAAFRAVTGGTGQLGCGQGSRRSRLCLPAPNNDGFPLGSELTWRTTHVFQAVPEVVPLHFRRESVSGISFTNPAALESRRAVCGYFQSSVQVGLGKAGKRVRLLIPSLTTLSSPLQR